MKARHLIFPTLIVLAVVLAACDPVTSAVPSVAIAPVDTIQDIDALPAPTDTAIASIPPSPTKTVPHTATPSKPTAVKLTMTPSFPKMETADYSNAPCPSFKYIEDITVPDGWEVGPDTVFTKTWRLQNTGRCTVSSISMLVFDHGDRMGAPAKTGLTTPRTVDSGEMLDVSVELVSPSAPGSYQAFFKIFVRHGPGNGSYAGISLWAKIRVAVPTATPPGAPQTRIVSSRITVAPAADKSVTAVCPNGTAVTGGGFSMANTREEYPYMVEDIYMDVYSMHMEGNGWSARGNNYGKQPVMLTVYAICLADPSARTTEVESAGKIPANGENRATAACPDGSVVTGGGFAGSGMLFRESTPSANGWQVKAKNLGDKSAGFSAYSVCLTGPSVSAASAKGANRMLDGTSGYAKAECPPGSALTGGGFINNGATIDEVSVHGRLWLAHAYNPIGSSNTSVAVVAACLAYA